MFPLSMTNYKAEAFFLPAVLISQHQISGCPRRPLNSLSSSVGSFPAKHSQSEISQVQQQNPQKGFIRIDE
jgi:hypothetical protein